MALPGVIDGTWVGPQWLADQGFQRHLLQTEYADKLLGDLLRRLRETGLYDRALMVVLADHGVSFRAGDRRRRPTPTNVQDVASMPLFIKLPGQREGGIEDTAVRTIDVLPTIADELGLKLREPVDGVPVERARRGSRQRDRRPRQLGARDHDRLRDDPAPARRSGGATSARCSRRPATTRSRWARGRTWSAAAPGDASPATAGSSSRTRASSRTSTSTRRCCRSGWPAP